MNKLLEPRNPPSVRDRLLATLEVTTDLVGITDSSHGQMFYLNKAGRRMLGVASAEDVASLRLCDFHPEWALDLIRRQGIPSAIRSGYWMGETAFLSRSLREIAVSQLILAHKLPDGRVEYLSTTARDITETKCAQEALRRSEELFRLITENATELIALVDLNGRRLYNSPSYTTVLGYSPEELQGSWSLEQTHPDDRAQLIAAAQKTKATGKGQTVEYRMRHRDGSWRTLESHAGVIRNEKGDVEHLLIVARDITERKRAEKERERMELELRHAQRMESIGHLAAGLAHEINTPVQYISDNTHFLRDAFAELNEFISHCRELLESNRDQSPTAPALAALEGAAAKADLAYLTAEIPKAIEQSIDGLERLATIITAMKEFSHPGTGEKTAIDLNKAIESTITVTRNEWKYVAEMVTQFDPALPLVPCYPGEFNQVVLNLIVNACHAITDRLGPSGNTKGTITVGTKKDGDHVEVRISDSGTGIPESVRDRIFEPFFTTKPMGKGTGQGLAITHSVIVEKHGGTVHFETEIGKGTTFVIRLPIVDASPPKPAASESSEPPL